MCARYGEPHLVVYQVFQRKLAMIALVVLSVYVTIGLLDSVHFKEALPEQNAGQQVQYSPETLSLLDKLLTPLRERVETSYSAPFALHLYTKQTIEKPDGAMVREYPRLKYGGAHLASAAQRPSDITERVLHATVRAVVLWLLVVLAILFVIARRKRMMMADAIHRFVKGNYEYPLRTTLISIGAVIWLLSLGYHLALHYHVFGTDKVGQDVLYLSLKSIRTGLVIGTLTTLVMLPFAILLGIMAGYFRGWVDDVIQYIYTTLNSIPGVLLIAAFILMIDVIIANHPERYNDIAVRADMRLLWLCIILGVTNWTGLCRLLRGEALKLREVDYVLAASAFGVRPMKILRKHLLPNVMHIVLISVVLDFSGLVLAEAVLSYVGVGVDPSMNSWGNMINSARLEMAREPVVWWSLMAAFVFMFALVLAANLFADAVRDAFDPRLRK